jgi:hypothetical protein
MSCLVKRSCMTALFVAAIGACGESEVERPANRPPTLMNVQADTNEDVPVDLHVLGGARDPDGDPLTVTTVSAGGHRADIVEGSIIRIVPTPNFHGFIAVSFRVSDRHFEVLGNTSVTVRPVNDAPVAAGGTLDIHGTDPITLTGSDIEGDALSFEVVGGPASGTLSGVPPTLVYTPDAGFIGNDEFTYRASDGAAVSEPATLQLRVGPGVAPVAQDAALSMNEDGQLALTLQATDADGSALTYQVVTPPEHGTLDGTPPNLTFAPDRDFNGNVAFEFTATDGYLTSARGIVSIRVAPVNDAPIATPQAVPTTEDTAIDITLAGSDLEGDALAFRIGRNPSHGTLTPLPGGRVTYTPDRDFHATDSFTFTASDGRLSSAAATVDINVAAADDPPVAMSFTRSTNEDVPGQVILVGSDVDGDPVSFTVTRPPEHGSLEGTPPNLTYRPDQDFNGPDSLQYTATAGGVTSAAGTVTLQVAPVNDPPQAADSSVPTDEDVAVAFTLQVSDIDSSNLTFQIVSIQPNDGTVGGTGANRTYTPTLNVFGTRTITFRVSDGGTVTSDGRVTITINPVNDEPTTRDDFIGTDVDTALTFGASVNDLDIDGDTLTVDQVDTPANGTAAIADGKVVYTPNAGFTGLDVFGYTVNDGHGGSARGTVRLGVGEFPPAAPTDRIATVTADPADRDNAPAISNDGRYVAFVTGSALVSDDTNAVSDIYFYDRSTRAVSRVSVASDGTQGNASSIHPRMSPSGRYIVFDSAATNLAAGDTNAVVDVFRHDRTTGQTVRVSVATGGVQANGGSVLATISDDGNFIAFTSFAFNLVSGDANGASDVFVRDVMADTTIRASVSITGNDPDLGSSTAAISGDGRRVAFISAATNLTPADNNNLADAFLRDMISGTTVRASVSSTGVEANALSSGSWLSRDGRFVSFLTRASNLVAPATFQTTVYVRDILGPTTTRPSPNDSLTWSRPSGDGRFLAEDTGGTVFIADRFAPAQIQIANADVLSWPVISSNGRYVVAVDTRFNAVGVTVVPNPLAP